MTSPPDAIWLEMGGLGPPASLVCKLGPLACPPPPLFWPLWFFSFYAKDLTENTEGG